jgi:hypothetical protein
VRGGKLNTMTALKKGEGECDGNRDSCGEWKGADMIEISSI